MKYFSILLLSIFIISSCKVDSPKSNISDAELHVAIKKDPNKLHPNTYPVARASQIYKYLFVPPADFNPSTLELEPILIKSLPTPRTITAGDRAGQIAYDIELHEGMTWEDGTPVTGADYVFTLKAIKHPETAAGSYRSYLTDLIDAEVDTKNPLKITIYFDEYYFLSREIVSTLEMYPKHI